MSGFAGDITWGDIKRWESDAHWGITTDRCECGGQGNDTIHDPATGKRIGSICELCDTEMYTDPQIAAEEAEMGIDHDDRDYCDKERGT